MDDQLEAEMRFSITPEWVLYETISDKAVRLYCVLARFADNNTHQAFPSRETLAAKMHCSVKSIDRAAQELIEIGAVSKKQRHNSSLIYTLKVSRGVVTSDQGGWSHMTRGVVTHDHLTITTELEPIELEPLNIDGFQEFWSVYPLKREKPKAQRAFAKAAKRAQSIDSIISGAVAYRDDPNRQDAYTKYPATWLNNDCWDDGPLPSKRKESAVERAMKVTMMFQQQKDQRELEGEQNGSR
jgi:hypothetical protein